MAEPGDLNLDELYAKSRTGEYDERVLAWRYRLSRGHVRKAIAESQLRRLCARETAGLEVNMADIHAVETELGDASGVIAFCQEMLRAPAAPKANVVPLRPQTAPPPQQQKQPQANGAKP
ncbi:MAG TPA: hypothetical protein VFI42_12900 [Thermomicrobiaceae bacterium]|nr:hypothetical protein [Thermomicrobiaceae bacterium]